MKLQECWTQQAVSSWSEAKIKAWAGRKSNPNEYFYRFTSPGKPQATGSFSKEEQRLFDERVVEFKRNGWPISCWGLFSLAIPGRVGYQCASHHRKQGGETVGGRATAVESAACVAYHAAQIQNVWASSEVQRVSAKVELWLASHEETAAPVSRQQEPSQRQQQQMQTEAQGACSGKQQTIASSLPQRHCTAEVDWSDSNSDFQPSENISRKPSAKPHLSAAIAVTSATAQKDNALPIHVVEACNHRAGCGSCCLADTGSRASQSLPTAHTSSLQSAPLAGSNACLGAAGLAAAGTGLAGWQRSLQEAAVPAPTRPPFHLSLGAARGSTGHTCRPAPSSTRAEDVTCKGQPAGMQTLTRRTGQSEITATVPVAAAAAAAATSSRAHAAAQAAQGRHPLCPAAALGKRKTVWAAEKPAATVAKAGSTVAALEEVSGADSDSDSDFIAGTLRQAALPIATNTGATVTAAAGATSASRPLGKLTGPSSKQHKKKKVWKSDALVLTSASLAQPAAADIAQVFAVKLQQQDREGCSQWPGWAPRPVAPYCPAAEPQTQLPGQLAGDPAPSSAAAGDAGWRTERLKTHHKTLGVVAAALQAAGRRPPYLAALISPGWWEQGEGVSVEPLQRLSQLPLPKLVPTGFVFIWAQKQHIHQVCRLVNRWGFVYVENLTWVWLSPGDEVLQLPSPLVRSSHLTLLIFRREGEGKDIELRHQRTADVTFGTTAMTQGGGMAVPEEVFAAIETLLPTGKGRFLELWAPRGAHRKGWTHIS